MTQNNTTQFQSINIALLTISDSRNIQSDKSGNILAERILNAKHNLITRSICKDNQKHITKILKKYCNQKNIQTIITTGGTGVTKSDVTPEACRALGGKEIPGFGELFRMLSYQKIGTSTIQSRCIAIVYKQTYIFALPGSPNACIDAWDKILLPQLDIRHKPCNFTELLPRL